MNNEDGGEIIDLRQPRADPMTVRTIAVTGIEAMVCEDIAARQQMGIKRYGQQLVDNPAAHIERLQHAYEEALDLANYLKWAIEQIKQRETL